MIDFSAWAFRTDARLANIEENLAGIASDLQQFKEETRIALTAIAKHLDVDLNPPTTT